MVEQRSWPADQPERRPLASLRPFPRNARTHSEAQIAQVAASITKWGWTFSVLISEDGEIIAGHARVLAAKRLGLTDVPCIVARGWTEAERRAYVITDNKIALNAGWDEGLLALEIGDLKTLGFDVGLTGFDEGEVAELFARANLKAGKTDPDAVGELPSRAFSKPGDVWLLGASVTCPKCGKSSPVEQAARRK